MESQPAELCFLQFDDIEQWNVFEYIELTLVWCHI